MKDFISGYIFACFFLVSLSFLRFWWKSRDRFFALFSLAFLLLAIERVVLAYLVQTSWEAREPVYLIRLLAFVIIIGSIYDRNKSRLRTWREKNVEDFAG